MVKYATHIPRHRSKHRVIRSITALSTCLLACGLAAGAPPGPDAVARGKSALLSKSHLNPSWTRAAYENVTTVWKDKEKNPVPIPDPRVDPDGYARIVADHYGLHPAPYPNDGLPMGLRTAVSKKTGKTGVMIDCLVCHGGSIGGTGMVGLGNTQLDLTALLVDMTRADNRRSPLLTFVLNSARGTVNAGQISAILLAVRNPDLSFRSFPLPLSAQLPEMDVPPWWNLARKQTMYCDGRTDANSVRSNMQFLLAELSRKQFEDLEPEFADIQAYLKSLKPPRYPFPIDRERASVGQKLYKTHCMECHGEYHADDPAKDDYPNVIVPLDRIGTDPARARGLSRQLVEHYNQTWFGAITPSNLEMTGYQAPPLRGIWASAPYFHNGVAPTLKTVLKSADRPARFFRPPSTSFDHYDTANVGWKFAVPPDGKASHEKSLVDTTRFGLGNGGHIFGDAFTDDQRSALIEYLKTL